MKTSVYYKTKEKIVSVLIHLLLISVSITCLFPLIWMISSSFKTQDTIFKDMSLIPAKFHFENYIQAWQQGGFARYFLNSIFYTIAVVAGIVLVSSMAAYAFSRLKFPGRNFLFLVFIAAMMIPVPGSFV
ncbi:MAG: carbohydrate ABC transporter permease, partial [Candidatus Omnitrophota bacterium]|nr:carbohydrate ABC transporter permease [Candidatus Omnitrophota bacterium]